MGTHGIWHSQLCFVDGSNACSLGCSGKSHEHVAAFMHAHADVGEWHTVSVHVAMCLS